MKNLERKALTCERLKELVRYEPDSGNFYCLKVVGTKRKVGGLLGSAKGAYKEFSIDGTQYLAHRLAWLYVKGKWPEKLIDHIDGDGTNNKIVNLREASHAINNQNQRKATHRNKCSGLLGVSPEKRTGKWYAFIKIGDKNKNLGTFLTPEDAHQAYVSAKRIHHPGCTL